MRLMLIGAACLAVASAATLHLTPATTTTRLYIVNPQSIRREYQTQDSKGFYSYGYSDDNAAKAEYTARDGSSRGFYSYVDTNGKLQTVKYEAGRKQGFKATATNLPKSPVDNRKAPQPVKDTPEVLLARRAHLEAIREVELREALAGNERELVRAEQEQLAQEQAQRLRERDEAASAEQSSANEAAEILARAREELLLALASRDRAEDKRNDNRDDVNGDDDDDDDDAGDSDDNDNERNNADAGSANNGKDRLSNTERLRLLQADGVVRVSDTRNSALENARTTTYTLKNLQTTADSLADPLGNLRTIYTLADDNSNSYLKLADLAERKSLTLLDERSLAESLKSAAGLTDDLRGVPVNSYYTLVSPSAKYAVSTPTVLTTVPSLDALHLSTNRLPISLSTSILTQRLNGKQN